MEGAGKGSECIKTLRMRGSVPVHRNLKCINAWRWRGKCPRTSKLSLPSCKTWRGREKGPSAERSVAIRQGSPLRSDRVIKHPVW